MKIEISYAEMAFLKELVAKEKYRIWCEEWVSRLTCSHKKVAEIFAKWDKKECSGVPLNNLDCCRLLLSKFEKIEENIQVELGVK